MMATMSTRTQMFYMAVVLYAPALALSQGEYTELKLMLLFVDCD